MRLIFTHNYIVLEQFGKLNDILHLEFIFHNVSLKTYNSSIIELVASFPNALSSIKAQRSKFAKILSLAAR